jgi:HAD superfamily hydrolase (TIGR01549 family)
MPVRGVIFDMGGTLLHYTPPGMDWEETEKLGAASVYRVLREHNCSLLPEDEALPLAWDHAREMWFSLIENYDAKVLKLDVQLNDLAARWGAQNLPDDVARQLPSAYMTAIQAAVRPLEGAVDTLHTLHDQGMHLGLISNTVWPGSVHVEDLDRHGLIPYLEHLIFSADVEAWKPYPEVFQMSLAALDLAPDEAVYVGDSLYFDVYGAQQAGLRGVWIEQSHRWLPDGIEVTPDATIQTLPDLLNVLAGWN